MGFDMAEDDAPSVGDVDEDGNPYVPEGVIRGIENLANGNTASKEDIVEAFKNDGEA